MEEKAVITIIIGDTFEEDFEIPRNIRYEKWRPIIEQYLKRTASVGDGSLDLYYKGNNIAENDTLKKLGVWDGCILEGAWR